MKLRAAAKINLMLDILGRTEEGYHTLFMIMQSVGIWDYVTLEKTGKPGTISLSCSNEALPTDQRNIAWKAADRFFLDTGIANPGISIHIEKHIPFAAGLAGGSADAAAVFVGLNELLEAGLSQTELCAIGVKTGADVPFCIQGGTMLALDIGGVLAPLPPVNPNWYVLCKPDQDVSTKEAYDAFDTAPYVRHLNTNGMLHAMVTGNEEAQFTLMGNVFEQFVEVPDRVAIKAIMRKHNVLAHMMSGSGPTTYGVYATKEEAEACAEELKKNDFTNVYVCQPQAQGVEIIEG